MAKYSFLVFTDAVEGREDEFNSWYDNTHLHDVLKVPGFVAARRFKLAEFQRGAPPDLGKYLAVYEIETDDLPHTLALLSKRSGTPAMVMSDAMAPVRGAIVYEGLSTDVNVSECRAR